MFLCKLIPGKPIHFLFSLNSLYLVGTKPSQVARENHPNKRCLLIPSKGTLLVLFYSCLTKWCTISQKFTYISLIKLNSVRTLTRNTIIVTVLVHEWENSTWLFWFMGLVSLVCFDNYSCQYLKDCLAIELTPSFPPFSKQKERETSSS